MNTQEIVETADIPANLNSAVCSVMAELRRIKKADQNSFAGYSFVSTDDVKDVIRPIMAKYGLSVSIDETDFRILEFTTYDNKTGKEKKNSVASYQFAIRLHHKSGEFGLKETKSISLPFVGAQTSGIAASYALKEWAKGRFLLSAGDNAEEADHINNTEKENDMRLGKEAARSIQKELATEMAQVVTLRSSQELSDWWHRKRHSINTLPKDWFLTMKAEYAEHWEKLKANEKLDALDNNQLDAMAMNQEDEPANVLMAG